MKKLKYIIVIILILILTVSCGIFQRQDLEGPDTNEDEGGQGGKDISDEDDVEPDVNYNDIEEDKNLTDDALKNGANKKDVSLLEKETLDKLDTDEIIKDLKDIDIVEKYSDNIPEDINTNLLYKNYSIPISYLLITKEGIKIYEQPSTNSNILGSAQFFSKIKLVGKAKDKNDEKNDIEWYIIAWMEDGETKVGYVTNDSGEVRRFRFKEMVDFINKLVDEMNETEYGYISNYKDRNGSPPLMNGKGVDKYGMQAYQSAPAYSSLDDKTDFRYFPDGSIVFITDEQGDYFKVKNLEYEGEYWIPKKYISFEDNIDILNKAIVIDVKNQNQGVFQRQGDNWNIVSYTLATTGVKERYKFETPRGYFKVLEKKERFYYLDDVTREVAGYAPYGTRFTAGAYIHGVPVGLIVKDGKKVEPEMQEYLFTIGTTPRSHKCVRNYTSHAKFIYNWSDPNDTVVIVIE